MRTIPTALVTLALTSSAYCQIGGSFDSSSSTMSHVWFPAAPAQMVVDRQDVGRELKLSPAQVSSIAAIEKAHAKTFMENFKEDWQLVGQVLNPQQRKRAEELAFQGLGVAAALLPGLQDKLDLTKDQVKKLAGIQHSYLLREDKDLLESQSGGAPVPADQMKAEREMHTRLLLDAISEVLTPSQRAKLKRLQGPAFNFTDPAPRPFSTWMRAMGMGG